MLVNARLYMWWLREFNLHANEGVRKAFKVFGWMFTPRYYIQVGISNKLFSPPCYFEKLLYTKLLFTRACKLSLRIPDVETVKQLKFMFIHLARIFLELLHPWLFIFSRAISSSQSIMNHFATHINTRLVASRGIQLFHLIRVCKIAWVSR